MADEIYLDSVNPTGLLQCIIEGDAQSVWMYLHDLESSSVIADAPICSLVALITIAEFKASYHGEGAPPLVSGYASEGSVMPDMTVERLRIEWGSAVPSVLVYVDDEPFTLIVASEKQGYSKAIVKPGPWGQPWNEETLNGTA
jgi:hypothetical protein